MADADTLIDRFLQKQDDIKDKWFLFAVNPYAAAYDRALASFEETLKAQEEARKAAEKAKWEMFMLVLSLCGGGLLTAAFGSTAAKTIVSDAAMNIIINHNLNRAFTAAHILATNKTAGFIAGKAWDEMEKRVGDGISDAMKKKMTESPANFPSTQGHRTWTTATTLQNFVLEAKVKGADLAESYRDNPGLTGEQKLAELAKLKSSPFYTPPTKSIDNGKLDEEIELSFHLGLVLKADYWKEISHYVTAYWGDSPGDRAEIQTPIYKTTDISINPDSTEYAKYRKGGGELLYKDHGAIIRKKLNELYKKRFNEDFMKGHLNHDLMIKAERGLKALASDNIVKNIQALGSGSSTG